MDNNGQQNSFIIHIEGGPLDVAQKNEAQSESVDQSNRVQISGRFKQCDMEQENSIQVIEEEQLIDKEVFKYDMKSLYLFKSDWVLRQIIIRTVDSKVFENLMILVIILNCISLGLYDYSDRNSMTQGNQMIDKSNIAFTSIFIMEGVLKIIAYGLYSNQNAYLRSGWNIIDAVVVLSAMLELSIESVKLKSLRILRIFRPLKTINAFPGMKKLISALITSIPDFVNVILFLVFIFMLFATLGLHQYNGAFYNACRINNYPESSVSWEADVSSGRLCSTSGLGNFQCENNLHCGNPSEYPYLDYIQSEQMDQRGFVNFGITNFDNIGTSLLSVFQIITSDTWYQQLCNFMDVDTPAFGGIYCILMIIIGQFFLLNLFLAVIVFSFIKSQKSEVQSEITMLKAEQDMHVIGEHKDQLVNQPIKQMTRREIIEEQIGTIRSPKKFKRANSAAFNNHFKSLKRTPTPFTADNTAQSNQQIQAKIDEVDFTIFLKSQVQKRKIAKMFLSSLWKPKLEEKDQVSNRKLPSLEKSQNIIDKQISLRDAFKSEEDISSIHSEDHLEEMEQTPPTSTVNQPEMNKMSVMIGKYMKHKIQNEHENYFKGLLKDASANTEQTNLRHLVSIKVGLEYLRSRFDDTERKNEETKVKIERKQDNRIYRLAQTVTESTYFSWSIAFVIVANTIILSLDRYPGVPSQASILEKINIAFTLIFTLELLIKLMAVGIKTFFKSSWFNTFDCIIVIASLTDLVVSNVLSSKSNNGDAKSNVITVLRTLRLLRVFKLAKHWKRLELLLETMGKSLIDISNFSVFLLIFMFIFTLLGLELFAYKAKINLDTSAIDLVDGVSPVFNFDTFLNSFSLVFIILTNDGQAAVFYNYYRAVGPAPATIFFVLLVVIGQKVVINLFVAILLENFDEGSLKQKLYEHEQNKIASFHSQNQSIISRVISYLKCQIQETSFILKNEQGRSLFIFSQQIGNRLQVLVKSTIFEYLIIIAIFFSAVTLALDGPLLDPNSDFKLKLYWVDTAMTVLFVLEASLKVACYGFLFNGTNSYMRQSWNQLDFLIIVFSLLSPLSNNYKAFKVLRVLRIVSRNEGLKVAVRALIRALPNVANVTSIMMLFFLIFGVISVSQFKGKFYFCEGSGGGHKWDCLNTGGEWRNHVYTFDDIPNALVTLFVMSTTAGWQDVLMNSITATEIDYVFQEQRSILWTLFFIVFMIIGYFFFINLFIGVVVSTFNSENDKIGGSDLLTEKQREWIDLKLIVLRSAPIKKVVAPPAHSWRMVFYKIQNTDSFNNFIFGCIAINSLILTLKWYQQPEVMTNILEIANYVFTGVFICEALIKMTGQGLSPYFNDAWNKFDIFVVACSVMSIAISANSTINIKGATTLLRSFRVLRILRLLKKGARSMHKIFNTFVITLQSLSNIGCLLLLVIYIYSILGMILFGHVKRNGLMNPYMNFENFINAFITLFTVVTGDSWNATQTSFVVLNDASNQCTASPTYADYLLNQQITTGCGGKVAAYLFFTSFTFIVSLIFFQLFIAIILQGYDQTQVQEARLFNDEMTQRFRVTWAEYDPMATTFINLYQLRDFLFAIGKPVGFDSSYEGKRFMQDKFIASLELPIYQNFSKYQFLDVLDALSFRLMVIDQLKQKSDKPDNVLVRSDSMMELEVKEKLSKEINRLLFQEQSDNITVVQDIIMKEMKKVKQKENKKDRNGLTSQHHMAAEATVRRMRAFIKICRSQKYQLTNQEKVNYRTGRLSSVFKRNGRLMGSGPVTGLIDRVQLFKIEDQSKIGEDITILFK